LIKHQLIEYYYKLLIDKINGHLIRTICLVNVISAEESSEETVAIGEFDTLISGNRFRPHLTRIVKTWLPCENWVRSVMIFMAWDLSLGHGDPASYSIWEREIWIFRKKSFMYILFLFVSACARTTARREMPRVAGEKRRLLISDPRRDTSTGLYDSFARSKGINLCISSCRHLHVTLRHIALIVAMCDLTFVTSILIGYNKMFVEKRFFLQYTI